MVARVILVLGGARSGKSSFAERWLVGRVPDGPWTYVATAEAFDDELRARIARHQARRVGPWHTVEAPRALGAAIAGVKGAALVDCVTLWLSNLLCDGAGDEAILGAVDELCAIAAAHAAPLAVVSNEVGFGVVPESPLGRRFRDLQGLANQALARAAEEVHFVTAGLPLRLK